MVRAARFDDYLKCQLNCQLYGLSANCLLASSNAPTDTLIAVVILPTNGPFAVIKLVSFSSPSLAISHFVSPVRQSSWSGTFSITIHSHHAVNICKAHSPSYIVSIVRLSAAVPHIQMNAISPDFINFSAPQSKYLWDPKVVYFHKTRRRPLPFPAAAAI